MTPSPRYYIQPVMLKQPDTKYAIFYRESLEGIEEV